MPRPAARTAALMTVVALAGCTPPGPNLRTPTPERYDLPPADAERFSKPTEYPKETLNQQPVKSTQGNLPSQRKGGPGMPSGSGGGGF